MLNPQVPSLLQKQILYLQLAEFAVVITDIVCFFQVSVRMTTEELRKKKSENFLTRTLFSNTVVQGKV